MADSSIISPANEPCSTCHTKWTVDKLKLTFLFKLYFKSSHLQIYYWEGLKLIQLAERASKRQKTLLRHGLLTACVSKLNDAYQKQLCYWHVRKYLLFWLCFQQCADGNILEKPSFAMKFWSRFDLFWNWILTSCTLFLKQIFKSHPFFTHSTWYCRAQVLPNFWEVLVEQDTSHAFLTPSLLSTNSACLCRTTLSPLVSSTSTKINYWKYISAFGDFHRDRHKLKEVFRWPFLPL